VGGGPTGVEMAGQIAEIARDTRRDFRKVDTSKARVLLIEALDRVLAGFPPSLSKRAFRSLESLGVTPLVNHMVSDVDADGVTVGTGESQERIPAKTVIWAAGVRAVTLATLLANAAGAPQDKAGRLLVEPDLTLPGHPEVMPIGDMVQVRDADALPGVAPVAMQQGRYAARAVRNRLAGKPNRSFRYRDKGNLATIGRARAVADLHVIKLSGFPAWVMWLLIHLWYLIGFQNRLLVFLRWTFSFLTHGRGARLITARHTD
jgi:NADH dehydrogenase